MTQGNDLIPLTFHIYQGDALVRSDTLSQDIIKIGKLETSHVVLDDDSVSRLHAVIEVSGPDEIHIIDLGSPAGTLVNGRKVSKSKLQSGDQIQFGQVLVVLEAGAASLEDEDTSSGAFPTYSSGDAADVRPPPADMTMPFGTPTLPDLQPVPIAASQGERASASVGALPNPFAPSAPEPISSPFAPQAASYGDSAHMEGGAMYDSGEERVQYQLLANGPPVSPDEVDSGDQAVEVMIMWGDESVLHVEHLSPPRAFTVGEAVDAKGKLQTNFLVGQESLGTDRLPVIIEAGGGTAVVIPQGAVGDVSIGEEYWTFDDIAAAGQLQPCTDLAGAQQYILPAGAVARVMHRDFTFVVRPVAAAKRVGIGGAPQIHWKQYTWTLASLLLHGAFLLMFYFLPPSPSSLSLDLLNADSRLVKYLIEPPETVEEETPEWLQDSKLEDDEGGEGKRHKDEEGQMGKKDEKKTNNKFGIEGPENNTDPHMAREAAKEEARTAGIIGILKAASGAWNSPTSPFGRDSALGNDPSSALGALMGDQIGSNFGFGGLGVRGTGRGGGGTGEGTIGLGNVGTIGHGAGGGTGSGYGSGAGGMKGRQAKVPQIRTGQADVRGSLSKEVIRRIIRRHINEVRFCYEQELNTRPDLEGRVSVKFIISPTGAVQNAAVASSTMNNAKVENCIATAARRWTFPAPEGGGIVIVTYPFVLAQSGG